MQILIVFVSAQDVVIDEIAARRGTLVPEDIRINSFAALGGEKVILSAYKVDKKSTVQGLLNHISASECKNITGLMLMTDGSMPALVEQLGDILCVNRFTAPTEVKKAGNILRSVLVKALKAFRHYKNRFEDLKYQQILRLPLRNFAADEIQGMRVACWDMMNRQNFGRELDDVLKSFRSNRQKPKKASSSPRTYLVDDEAKHFSLGFEVHAQADTAIPPHDQLCLLANGYRFGRWFDGTRHYNVSRDRDEKMAGNYLDCHNAQKPGTGAKHLNMFTNDFF